MADYHVMQFERQVNAALEVRAGPTHTTHDTLFLPPLGSLRLLFHGHKLKKLNRGLGDATSVYLSSMKEVVMIHTSNLESHGSGPT